MNDLDVHSLSLSMTSLFLSSPGEAGDGSKEKSDYSHFLTAPPDQHHNFTAHCQSSSGAEVMTQGRKGKLKGAGLPSFDGVDAG